MQTILSRHSAVKGAEKFTSKILSHCPGVGLWHQHILEVTRGPQCPARWCHCPLVASQMQRT